MCQSEYVYRVDSWSTQQTLHGNCLRARFWSRKHKESFPHAPLMSAEESLRDGEAIFRTSFWMAEQNFTTLIGRPEAWGILWVLQRVRADHPFFANFTRIPDDHLPNTAWLYWKIGKRDLGQEWTPEGIPKSDIEVLDLDGQWRVFDRSMLMQETDSRLATLGFRPFYCQLNVPTPFVVYCASRYIENLPGGSAIVLLVVGDPQRSALTISTYEHVLKDIVAKMLASVVGVPIASLRFFILGESEEVFHADHLLDIPLQEVWKDDPNPMSFGERLRSVWYGKPKIRSVVPCQKSEKWHKHDSDIYEAVIEAFEFPTQRRLLDRYRKIVSSRLQVLASDSVR